MYHLIYFSTGTKHFSEMELSELLKESRKNNQKNNITGILLLVEGCFLQILEGEKSTIKTLYNKVKKDTRHNDILKISEGTTQERVFKEWSMGFKNIPFVEYKKQVGFEDISNGDFIEKVIKTNHPRIIQTLHHFYDDIS
ncbi:MAG: BLUF domain-containing protein [Saprospiraceae bacterium]